MALSAIIELRATPGKSEPVLCKKVEVIHFLGTVILYFKVWHDHSIFLRNMGHQVYTHVNVKIFVHYVYCLHPLFACLCCITFTVVVNFLNSHRLWATRVYKLHTHDQQLERKQQRQLVGREQTLSPCFGRSQCLAPCRQAVSNTIDRMRPSNRKRRRTMRFAFLQKS